MIKITPVLIKEAVKLRLTGMSYKEVGESLGITLHQAYRVVHLSGTKIPETPRGPVRNQEKLREALNLRHSGLSYSEIGKRFGVSRQRIQQLLKPPKYLCKQVKNEAENKCQRCGIETFSGHVHHRDDRAENYNSKENLMYVCVTCHSCLTQGY